MVNEERIRRDVVTIGASAGGVEALRALFGALPHDLAATVGVVIHRSPLAESRLPFVLGARSKIPVVEPRDGDPFEVGRIYTAPRDHHMELRDGQIHLHRGAKEHRTRPAIDPLFRSAAAAFGPRVLGVLLTGFGDDGVPGLIAIKAAGGLSLVQDPSEATHPIMPQTAIAEDDVDGVMRIADLACAITALAAGRAISPPALRVPTANSG